MDYRIKLKESERDKSLDFARELKKLRNIKVTVIPFVIRALGKFHKGSVRILEDLVLGITDLFPQNELVHLPYIAVATNTSAN